MKLLKFFSTPTIQTKCQVIYLLIVLVVPFIQVLGLMKMYLFRALLRQVFLPVEEAWRLNF